MTYQIPGSKIKLTVSLAVNLWPEIVSKTNKYLLSTNIKNELKSSSSSNNNKQTWITCNKTINKIVEEEKQQPIKITWSE